MEKPTQEQIKEFWEWCGFEKHLDFDTGTSYWRAPDGICGPDAPPIDPNNLFRYAVPKLKEVGGCFLQTEYHPITQEWQYHAWAYRTGGHFGWGTNRDDPALALFWALYRVLGDTKKEEEDGS